MAVSNTRLLLHMIRNRKIRSLNREMVGHCVVRQVGPVLVDDAAAYAAATNDINPLYEGAEAYVPPMFIAKLTFPMLIELILDKNLDLNLLRMVHGQQQFESKRPIQVGETLTIKMTVAGVEDTPAGELLSIEFLASGEDGEIGLAKTGLIVRGVGRGNKKAEKKDVPSDPDFTIEIPTDSNQARRYADASGDRNLIHTSNLVAKLSGLPGVILHGMCTMAMASNALTSHLAGGDFRKLSHFGVRFAAPAIPGELLTLKAYPETSEGIPFEVMNEKGKAVMKHGILSLRH